MCPSEPVASGVKLHQHKQGLLPISLRESAMGLSKERATAALSMEREDRGLSCLYFAGC